MLKVTTIDNDTGSAIREQLLRSRSIVRVIDCTAIITAVDSHHSRGRGGYRIAIDCKSCCQTINGTKHFGICNCNLAAAFILMAGAPENLALFVMSLIVPLFCNAPSWK